MNGSLAVSRAFGDIHLKDWIISEPEIVKLPLTSDCQFLILASDGLWDKVRTYCIYSLINPSVWTFLFFLFLPIESNSNR